MSDSNLGQKSFYVTFYVVLNLYFLLLKLYIPIPSDPIIICQLYPTLHAHTGLRITTPHK